MAEEQNAEQEEKKSSTLVKNLIIFGVAIAVPAIIAVGIFQFVLKPSFGNDDEADKAPDVKDPLPMSMTEVVFADIQVSVRTEDPDMVAPLLIAGVTLWCRDEAASSVVDGRKNKFAAMILKLHQGRTRSELNDPLVQNSIREQIKQQANILLRRLNPEAELEVLSAEHLKYTVVDL